jgi:hypothetical protein
MGRLSRRSWIKNSGFLVWLLPDVYALETFNNNGERNPVNELYR